jgi:hypothetical protein
MKIKSRIIIGILFLLPVFEFSLEAQVIYKGSKTPDFKQLLQSGIQVVLTGHESTDKALKEAITKYWAVSTYTFITEAEADEAVSDKSKTYLKYEFASVGAYGGSTAGNTSVFALIAGGKKAFQTIYCKIL